MENFLMREKQLKNEDCSLETTIISWAEQQNKFDILLAAQVSNG
jgi:hypothetical protein